MWISCGRTVNKLWKTRGNEREFDSVSEFQNQARFERGFAVFRACKPNSPTLSNSRYLGEMFSPSIMGVFQYYVWARAAGELGLETSQLREVGEPDCKKVNEEDASEASPLYSYTSANSFWDALQLSAHVVASHSKRFQRDAIACFYEA
jgi:hypothetical protein